MANRNEKTWQLVFDPRTLSGDFEGSYDVGALFDRLNLKMSIKVDVFYEGLVFRNVVTGKMLIVIKDPCRHRFVLHEINYAEDRT